MAAKTVTKPASTTTETNGAGPTLAETIRHRIEMLMRNFEQMEAERRNLAQRDRELHDGIEQCRGAIGVLNALLKEQENDNHEHEDKAADPAG